MTNEDVVRAFVNGKSAEGNSLTSNGDKLYSYSLLIAYRTRGGSIHVYDYTASGEFISHTTSKHVGLLREHLAVRSVEYMLLSKNGCALQGAK